MVSRLRVYVMWNDMWKTNGYYINISPAIDSEPTMMVKSSMRVWVLECRLPFSVCSRPKFQSRDDFWEKVFDSGKGPQKTYLIININTQRESRSLASSSSKKDEADHISIMAFCHYLYLPLASFVSLLASAAATCFSNVVAWARRYCGCYFYYCSSSCCCCYYCWW